MPPITTATAAPSSAAAMPAADGACWRLYRTPGEAWDAMYEDCRRARRSIEFEQYIMEDDAVGRRFLGLFRAKAREGVRVRMLCDMFGSLSLYRALGGSPPAAADGEPAIRFYNPVRPWRLGRMFSWSRRDHRKLAVVDSTVGYTGGICHAARMRSWRDTMVRIQGSPAVGEMERAFDLLWRGIEGRRAAAPGEGGEEEPAGADGPARAFRLVTNAPHPHRNRVYAELLERLRAARSYAYITTPYFVPDPPFLRALVQAARRGVDVRLLLPRDNDVPLIMWVSESYYGRLLRAGVRIFLYEPEVLHAKAMVVDGAWATVGSANLDYLSFFGNQEANLVATEPRFAADVERDFLADLEVSREVRPEAWRRRWHPRAALVGRAGRLLLRRLL